MFTELKCCYQLTIFPLACAHAGADGVEGVGGDGEDGHHQEEHLLHPHHLALLILVDVQLSRLFNFLPSAELSLLIITILDFHFFTFTSSILN